MASVAPSSSSRFLNGTYKNDNNGNDNINDDNVNEDNDNDIINKDKDNIKEYMNVDMDMDMKNPFDDDPLSHLPQLDIFPLIVDYLDRQSLNQLSLVNKSYCSLVQRQRHLPWPTVTIPYHGCSSYYHHSYCPSNHSPHHYNGNHNDNHYNDLTFHQRQEQQQSSLLSAFVRFAINATSAAFPSMTTNVNVTGADTDTNADNATSTTRSTASIPPIIFSNDSSWLVYGTANGQVHIICRRKGCLRRYHLQCHQQQQQQTQRYNLYQASRWRRRRGRRRRRRRRPNREKQRCYQEQKNWESVMYFTDDEDDVEDDDDDDDDDDFYDYDYDHDDNKNDIDCYQRKNSIGSNDDLEDGQTIQTRQEHHHYSSGASSDPSIPIQRRREGIEASSTTLSTSVVPSLPSTATVSTGIKYWLQHHLSPLSFWHWCIGVASSAASSRFTSSSSSPSLPLSSIFTPESPSQLYRRQRREMRRQRRRQQQRQRNGLSTLSSTSSSSSSPSHPPMGVSSLQFSSDDQYLAVGYEHGIIRIWKKKKITTNVDNTNNARNHINHRQHRHSQEQQRRRRRRQASSAKMTAATTPTTSPQRATVTSPSSNSFRYDYAIDDGISDDSFRDGYYDNNDGTSPTDSFGCQLEHNIVLLLHPPHRGQQRNQNHGQPSLSNDRRPRRIISLHFVLSSASSVTAATAASVSPKFDLVSLSEPNEIRRWSLDTGTCIQIIHPNPYTPPTMIQQIPSANAETSAAGASTMPSNATSTTSATSLPSYRFTHLTVSPDERFLACGSLSNGTVHVWEDWKTDQNPIVGPTVRQGNNVSTTATTTTTTIPRYFIVLPVGETYPTSTTPTPTNDDDNDNTNQNNATTINHRSYPPTFVSFEAKAMKDSGEDEERKEYIANINDGSGSDADYALVVARGHSLDIWKDFPNWIHRTCDPYDHYHHQHPTETYMRYYHNNKSSSSYVSSSPITSMMMHPKLGRKFVVTGHTNQSICFWTTNSRHSRTTTATTTSSRSNSRCRRSSTGGNDGDTNDDDNDVFELVDEMKQMLSPAAAILPSQRTSTPVPPQPIQQRQGNGNDDDDRLHEQRQHQHQQQGRRNENERQVNDNDDDDDDHDHDHDNVIVVINPTRNVVTDMQRRRSNSSRAVTSTGTRATTATGMDADDDDDDEDDDQNQNVSDEGADEDDDDDDNDNDNDDHDDDDDDDDDEANIAIPNNNNNNNGIATTIASWPGIWFDNNNSATVAATDITNTAVTAAAANNRMNNNDDDDNNNYHHQGTEEVDVTSTAVPAATNHNDGDESKGGHPIILPFAFDPSGRTFALHWIEQELLLHPC